jgi:hypothetical protein
MRQVLPQLRQGMHCDGQDDEVVFQTRTSDLLPFREQIATAQQIATAHREELDVTALTWSPAKCGLHSTGENLPVLRRSYPAVDDMPTVERTDALPVNLVVHLANRQAAKLAAGKPTCKWMSYSGSE